jgi:hypothetical protein
VLGVLDDAAENARSSIFKLGIAKGLRSQPDNLLLFGETLPGVEHICGTVAGAVEQHHRGKTRPLSGEE